MYKTEQTRSRYSNLGGTYTLGGSWESYGGTEGLMNSNSSTTTTTDNSSNLGNNSAGSGLLNSIPGMLNTVGSVLSNIFSPSSRYTSTMYENMYAQEKRTTNLLIGVVVALVILAFVFIILKNRKG